MTRPQALSPGIGAALGAALLFGAGTPLAKLQLQSTDPWLLAGLLYAGSGLGLTLWRLLRPAADRVRLARGEGRWLAAAVLAGGIVAPVLLMWGLAHMQASAAALLLNAETVFTVIIARLAFREHVGGRVAAGMLVIVAGAAVLSWPRDAAFDTLAPPLAVLAACLAWGLDNNLTRRISLADATLVASIKGLTAGATNLALALALGAAWPAAARIGGALAVGFLAYGVSLVLFVIALRHLGAARTGGYFGVAPFFGAAMATLLLGEPVTPTLLAAAALMAIGVWLHAGERHAHSHVHEPLDHDHEHDHDDHHQHHHDDAAGGDAAGGPHTHRHRHAPLQHAHAHTPDAHHRHGHG